MIVVMREFLYLCIKKKYPYFPNKKGLTRLYQTYVTKMAKTNNIDTSDHPKENFDHYSYDGY